MQYTVDVFKIMVNCTLVTVMNKFSEKLRAALNKYRLSQHDLAIKIERKRSRVNHYLNSNDIPLNDTYIVCVKLTPKIKVDTDKFCLFIPGSGSPQVLMFDTDLQTKGKCYIIIGGYNDRYL